MQVWVPVKHNKFITEYTLSNLEDCIDDVFYSNEEKQELCRDGWFGVVVNNDILQPVLESIVQQYNEKYNPENKKSVVVKEIEQITNCKGDTCYHLLETKLKHFLNQHNIHRVGTRLSPKAQRVEKRITNIILFALLKNVLTAYCRKKYGCWLEVSQVSNDKDYCMFLQLLKVHITFEQLLSFIKSLETEKDSHICKDVYESFTKKITNNNTNLEYLKQIYENPELLLNPTVV